MAIPISVPDEERAPAPQSATTFASVTPTPALVSNGTFLNQLVLELYSTYVDFCQTQNAVTLNSEPEPSASASSNSNSSGSDYRISVPLVQSRWQTQVQDINNNSSSANTNGNHGHGSEGSPGSAFRRRRRHPAGRNGYPDTSQEHLLPLPGLPPQIRSEADHDQVTMTELELKVSVAENLGVGVSLRQIADSYQIRYSRCTCPVQDKTWTSKYSKISTSLSIDIDVDVSWPWFGRSCPTGLLLAFGSAFLTVSAAVAYFRLRGS